MGKIQGTYDVKINGDGIVHTRTRAQVFDTWFYPDEYILNSDHMLENVKKDLYEMNRVFTTKAELPLQKSRTENQIICRIQPGNEITITMCDNKEWYLVKGPSGLEGWFRVDTEGKISGTNLDLMEMFDGNFCFAD